MTAKPQPSTKGPAAILAGALAAAGATAYFVAPWEGRSLVPYRDIVGVWTWCDGETSGIRKELYTPAECDALLTNSIAKHLRGLAKCVHVPLKQNEWIALGSWVYNVGETAACKSTLVRKINAGQPFCAELLKWDRAGGKKVRGLTRRREAEYKVCMTP